ncbi:MAG TPA: bifunctional hydroxymethylpyrimidine kinase/phosphomethylpyrimidine kinase [Candidatus Angelobacter sp.]|nr:bifunctional hydroxymethylpyrimidine kinase/phosphomethylpyrimidine kinase [Candidatus Angelobacter sp.]
MPSKIEAGPRIILSIAGYDPSSGAGVTADIKTAAAHGCYAITCVTALTVQSTQGVKRFEPVDTRILTETLEELAADFTIAAVRIGMLGSPEIMRATAAFIRRHQLKNVVLDPVLKASSGLELISRNGPQILKEKLLPLALVITPNIDEAAALTGLPVTNAEEMRIAAVALHKIGARNVIITGGHLDPPVDLMSLAAGQGIKLFQGKKISGRSTHGTGCAFATSLACNLALGRTLIDSTKAAKQYVANALKKAVPVGKGRGPVNHFVLLAGAFSGGKY